MQANPANHQAIESANPILGLQSGYVDCSILDGDETAHDAAEPTHFRGYYSNCMEMLAEASTVAMYLDEHREWFRRCSSPLKADPLGENGYALTIGHFNTFGYEVEPKVGLNLLPQDQQGVYRIETIAIPDYEPPGYDVDFQAALELVEGAFDPAQFHLDGQFEVPVMTRVEWELHLDVAIQFPRFIQALPKSLVQSTGDRLLNQIVRQVSRCLTHKVQEDFHTAHQLPFPKRRKRHGWRWGNSTEQE